ncbi:retrovirus-related pol polyprotein from transposon TNT 1-94, partial [Tanacetum coccineum]
MILNFVIELRSRDYSAFNRHEIVNLIVELKCPPDDFHMVEEDVAARPKLVRNLVVPSDIDELNSKEFFVLKSIKFMFLRMILNLVQNGPLIWPTITDADGTTRTKKYEELYATEKIQAYCDCKATNIDRVKLLMQGTKLSLQEKECKLYDEFDKFTFVKGETLYQYYWRFSQLINNMNVINMSMRAVQFPQLDSCLAVLVFTQGDDPIACLNKAMDFLTAVASSSYEGNDTSLRGNNTGGQARMVKCYNCQGEGHMARQRTQPKRPRNAAWFKEKEIVTPPFLHIAAEANLG